MRQTLFKILVSYRNPIVDCESFESIPRMNLYPWKEVENSAWHVAEDGVKWFPDCDFPGYDIGYVQQVADGGQCAQKCKESTKCNAFWASDGWCTLKTIPTWHHRAHLSGGICGFVPEKFWFLFITTRTLIGNIPTVKFCKLAVDSGDFLFPFFYLLPWIWNFPFEIKTKSND